MNSPTTATHDANDAVFIAGKPLTDIWAPPGLRWGEKLRSAIRSPLRNPRLRFVRNDRNHFDLDNLAYPVLAASGSGRCESVWATVERGPTEGVWVWEQVPPPAPSDSFSVRIEKPSTESVATRRPPPELAAATVVADGLPLALALEFDSAEVSVGELSYTGPTKSLIDDLGPVLGFRPYMGRRVVSEDERVKELRITRGHSVARTGVTVRLWPL